MTIKYQPNESNQIIMERDDRGIYFGAVLADEQFLAIDMSAITADEILMIVVSSIANMVDTIATNVDRDLGETLFDESIKALVFAKKCLMSASNDAH